MKMVCGKNVEYEYFDRKLTIKDFELFDYNSTYEEVLKKVGEPNGIWGYDVGHPYYELSDGRFVVCNFWLDEYTIWIKVGNKKIFEYELLSSKLPEKSEEEIELELKNIQSMEMNVIMDMLGLNKWNPCKAGSSDWDEPLGMYSRDRLNEYADTNINISYYIGNYKGNYHKLLFQLFEIQDSNKPIHYLLLVWREGCVFAEKEYYGEDQKTLKYIDIKDDDLSNIELSREKFSYSILNYLSERKEIKRGRDSWIEFWGEDKNGNYMCVYNTSFIKREEGIDDESKCVSHYYVIVESEEGKAGAIYIRELKFL